MEMGIADKLFAVADPRYREFQIKLCPTVDPSRIIGVRTPELRRLAREIGLDDLGELPHTYFEEDQLHAFILSELRDHERVIFELDRFLPHIDNWATCDQLRPRIFAKHTDELLNSIDRWLASKEVYTIRFGIEMLMVHYLDKHFKVEYLERVAAVSHDDYYVKMMQAWYFATALAKQYEATLPLMTECRLEKWVHNKTIQKSIESYRISDEKKDFLKTRRIK